MKYSFLMAALCLGTITLYGEAKADCPKLTTEDVNTAIKTGKYKDYTVHQEKDKETDKNYPLTVGETPFKDPKDPNLEVRPPFLKGPYCEYDITFVPKSLEEKVYTVGRFKLYRAPLPK